MVVLSFTPPTLLLCELEERLGVCVKKYENAKDLKSAGLCVNVSCSLLQFLIVIVIREPFEYMSLSLPPSLPQKSMS
jgi:hypothetical protein